MKNAIAIALVVLLGGCASVPLLHGNAKPEELPAASLDQLALQLERAVQTGEREPVLSDRDGIVVNVPTIQQALRTRAARVELINKLLDSGFAQEDQNGLISTIRGKEYKKATSSRQRSRDALLVMNEDSDRWTIYEGIVENSKFPRGSLNVVQSSFHKARIQTMKSGQKYQDETGTIVSK